MLPARYPTHDDHDFHDLWLLSKIPDNPAYTHQLATREVPAYKYPYFLVAISSASNTQSVIYDSYSVMLCRVMSPVPVWHVRLPGRDAWVVTEET
jgi:hypothetical protein